MIKTKLAAKRQGKVHDLRRELTINAKRGLSTHIKAYLDDKLIIDEPGHSIVGNFIDELYCCMLGKSNSDTPADIYYYRSLNPRVFTSVENSGGFVRLNYDDAYGELYYGSDTIEIYNSSGSVTSLDGSHTITTGSSSSNYVVLGTAWSADYAGATGLARITRPAQRYNVVYHYHSANNNYMNLFLGTDDTAVDIDDKRVDITPYLIHGTTAQSVVVPDPASDKVSLTYTMTATNSSGGAVTVKDVGLFRRGYDSGTYLYYLMARDVLSSPVSIADGGRLTIEYTIQTEMDFVSDDAGGFTEQFLSLFRRTVGWTTQSVTDIVNTPRAGTGDYGTNGYFCWRPHYTFKAKPMARVGVSEPYQGYYLGIRCGTGTTTPTIDDYWLKTSIAEGDSGFYYWGTEVNNFDMGSGYRSFDIVSLVENPTAGDITISELGLVVCQQHGGDNYMEPSYAAMIARHVLSAADPDNRITVGAGDFCRITYTIKVEV